MLLSGSFARGTDSEISPMYWIITVWTGEQEQFKRIKMTLSWQIYNWEMVYVRFCKCGFIQIQIECSSPFNDACVWHTNGKKYEIFMVADVAWPCVMCHLLPCDCVNVQFTADSKAYLSGTFTKNVTKF